jgi:hypothetical protein
MLRCPGSQAGPRSRAAALSCLSHLWGSRQVPRSGGRYGGLCVACAQVRSSSVPRQWRHCSTAALLQSALGSAWVARRTWASLLHLRHLRHRFCIGHMAPTGIRSAWCADVAHRLTTSHRGAARGAWLRSTGSGTFIGYGRVRHAPNAGEPEAHGRLLHDSLFHARAVGVGPRSQVTPDPEIQSIPQRGCGPLYRTPSPLTVSRWSQRMRRKPTGEKSENPLTFHHVAFRSQVVGAHTYNGLWAAWAVAAGRHGSGPWLPQRSGPLASSSRWSVRPSAS